MHFLAEEQGNILNCVSILWLQNLFHPSGSWSELLGDSMATKVLHFLKIKLMNLILSSENKAYASI
jgi:hypothetical protein